ncbi:efflux RND transporter periplasmic adaptor subunit [Xanthomonas oryzae]|uniref:efflux RND transporter periplasmic adaptor subunit n=1 Tax=Xanthomonas oryzae TaxID=347 RepID=UPI00006790D2|nr:efflux RND transporter periplasmic adaptor subunit [Xanthomonas oryzae]AOS02935.1 GntR family transcriptional regulator [Xanthomonas oryzae pv. oryzae]AOS27879.1 GntR family transcriptional regulator [Xanthomonas oryzae pv. oryzae]AQU45888.1 GntR family transcriptional regulator [Xanthomonas oryzae pv. oryzae]AWK18906.1 efflux transporter periplasmic adaptor subunit [Xanthomonas oryzae pv. oryzae]AXI17029.1 efflux RND transporter periplasmic adaptor subunit [Xanthomonas oryzae pv. oryzae]
MIALLRSFGLACAITVALAACSKPEQQQAPPPEVSVLEMKPQTLPLERDLVGRLSAYRSADVRARVDGVVLKRLYTEGANVKEGQPLFQIDPSQLKATLLQAQGQLAAAEATYTNAKIAATRARSLAPQQYVSRADIDTAEANERSSGASVQQARGAVEAARIHLSFATVTSPITGRAGIQRVTEGALVGAGEATLLTTVDQIDPLYVNFAMNSEELAALRQAQSSGNVQLSGDGKSSINVELGNGTQYQHPGTLDVSAVTVNPSTGAVSLRATLPNPEQSLLPGAFVTFKASLGQRNNAYLLPQQALQRDATGPYVLVLDKDGKVARKNLTVDGQQKGQWIVTGGMTQGDQVIVDGVQKAKQGQPAKGVPWDPNKPAQGGQPGSPGAAPAAAQSGDAQAAPSADKADAAAPAAQQQPKQDAAAQPADSQSTQQ